MEQTITASGALFQAHRKQAKQARRSNAAAQTETPAAAIFTFRASVGDFALRRAQVGYELEINVGEVRRLLGVYVTPDAALLALQNRKTHYDPWDHTGRNAVAIQLETDQRWDRQPWVS